MAVAYEWDVETQISYHDGNNDVIDHYHCGNLKEAIKRSSVGPESTPEGKQEDFIVLVRDDDEGRTWAYLQDDGKLPEFFMNAEGKNASRVPQRFHDEVTRSS